MTPVTPAQQKAVDAFAATLRQDSLTLVLSQDTCVVLDGSFDNQDIVKAINAALEAAGKTVLL